MVEKDSGEEEEYISPRPSLSTGRTSRDPKAPGGQSFLAFKVFFVQDPAISDPYTKLYECLSFESAETAA